MQSSNYSYEPKPIKTPLGEPSAIEITSECFNQSDTFKPTPFEISGRKFSNSSQINSKFFCKQSPKIITRNQTSLINLKSESKSKEKTPKQENNSQAINKTNKIKLPKLSSTMRVERQREYVYDNKQRKNDTTFFRRRMNSEEEENLIYFTNSKLNLKRQEDTLNAKHKKNIREIIKEESDEKIETKSKVIYDKSEHTKINALNRKQSVDLNLRSKNICAEIRNKSQGITNENSNKTINNIFKSEFIIQNEGNPFVLKTNDEKINKFYTLKNSLAHKKNIRKESEANKEIENEPTKGSSFNTENNCNKNNSLNGILNHSVHNSRDISEDKSNNENTKINIFVEKSFSALPEKKLFDLKNQNPFIDIPEGDQLMNKRKGSWFSNKHLFYEIDKSINEGIYIYSI